MRALILPALLSATTALAAPVEPGPHDVRIKWTTYMEDDTTRLVLVRGVQTAIVFEMGEAIGAVGSPGMTVQPADQQIPGVPGGYTALIGAPPNTLFIEPLKGAKRANMTITTDRRLYFFDVIPQPASFDGATFGLRFIYPKAKEPPKPPGAAELYADYKKVPEESRKYEWGRSPLLAPQDVFHHHGKTYFLLDPLKPVPAIYAVENGETMEVNSHRDGAFIVVHRRAQQFELRRDALQTCVFYEGPDGTAVPPERYTSAEVER